MIAFIFALIHSYLKAFGKEGIVDSLTNLAIAGFLEFLLEVLILGCIATIYEERENKKRKEQKPW